MYVAFRIIYSIHFIKCTFNKYTPPFFEASNIITANTVCSLNNYNKISTFVTVDSKLREER